MKGLQVVERAIDDLNTSDMVFSKASFAVSYRVN